jgi:hypothetical protein
MKVKETNPTKIHHQKYMREDSTFVHSRSVEAPDIEGTAPIT